MKKLIVLLLAITLFVAAFGRKDMGIRFTHDPTDQTVEFADASAMTGLTQKSIVVHVKFENIYALTHIIGLLSNTYNVDEFYDIFYNNEVTPHLSFSQAWSGGGGQWRIVTALSPHVEYDIAITYDSSSTSNDPVFYINGVSQSVLETTAPSGSLVTGTNTNFEISSSLGVFSSIDGTIGKAFIYNRILTASEILDMYTSRGASYPRNGLVFCPVLWGAKGLQAFDGATLGATNLIVDPCSGATGVPTGNPVGVGETYLSIK